MKRAGSYFVAWSLTCLYLFATMASTVIVSRQIVGLAAYRDPAYVPAPVHVWAINVAVLFVCLIINVFGIRAMHSIQSFSLVWFIVGFIVWLIVPLVKAQGTVGYTPAKEVFTGELNLSGWNAFVAFMIGTAGVGAGYGIPCAVSHVAEETPRPETDLPKIMILSPLISLVTATAMCLAFLFCNVPQISMALSPTGEPFIDFLATTINHRPGVTVMSVILIYAQFVACLECQLASSRTMFTFAREGGAFFPSFFGRVNLYLQVPIWTILFNFVFCAALTLLILGSQTALNVFLNCAGTLALCTYLPLFIASMVSGRRFYKGPFSLGRWGYPINMLATVYLCLVVIFWFFPYMKNWQADISMFSESSYPPHGRHRLTLQTSTSPSSPESCSSASSPGLRVDATPISCTAPSCTRTHPLIGLGLELFDLFYGLHVKPLARAYHFPLAPTPCGQHRQRRQDIRAPAPHYSKFQGRGYLQC